MKLFRTFTEIGTNAHAVALQNPVPITEARRCGAFAIRRNGLSAGAQCQTLLRRLRELQFLRWLGFAGYGTADPDALQLLGLLSPVLSKPSSCRASGHRAVPAKPSHRRNCTAQPATRSVRNMARPSASSSLM